MSEQHLLRYSGSHSVWPGDAIILSGSDGYITGSLQDFNNLIAVNSIEFVYLQRNTATINVINNLVIAPLQRFNMYSYKLPATIVWLMRARNTANTRYVYWRSPHNPNSFGISGIIDSTVESVGSVYEEI